MSIYKRLEKDHDKQRELIEEVKSSTPGSEARTTLWNALKVELESHASAEEQAFYSKLMVEPEGTDDTRHAIEEHQQMHEMIEKLDAMDQGVAVWDELFSKLAHKVIHHVDEEEAEFFPDAKDTLTETQEAKALKEFNDRKKKEVRKQEQAA